MNMRSFARRRRALLAERSSWPGTLVIALSAIVLGCAVGAVLSVLILEWMR